MWALIFLAALAAFLPAPALAGARRVRRASPPPKPVASPPPPAGSPSINLPDPKNLGTYYELLVTLQWSAVSLASALGRRTQSATNSVFSSDPGVGQYNDDFPIFKQLEFWVCLANMRFYNSEMVTERADPYLPQRRCSLDYTNVTVGSPGYDPKNGNFWLTTLSPAKEPVAVTVMKITFNAYDFYVAGTLARGETPSATAGLREFNEYAGAAKAAMEAYTHKLNEPDVASQIYTPYDSRTKKGNFWTGAVGGAYNSVNNNKYYWALEDRVEPAQYVLSYARGSSRNAAADKLTFLELGTVDGRPLFTPSASRRLLAAEDAPEHEPAPGSADFNFGTPVISLSEFSNAPEKYMCTPVGPASAACVEYKTNCNVFSIEGFGYQYTKKRCPNGVGMTTVTSVTNSYHRHPAYSGSSVLAYCCETPDAWASDIDGFCQCPWAVSNPLPPKLKLSFYDSKADCLARTKRVAKLSAASTAKCGPAYLILSPSIGIAGTATSTSPVIRYLRSQLGIEPDARRRLPSTVNVRFLDNEGIGERGRTSIPQYKFKISTTPCSQIMSPDPGDGGLHVSMCSLQYDSAGGFIYILGEAD